MGEQDDVLHLFCVWISSVSDRPSQFESKFWVVLEANGLGQLNHVVTEVNNLWIAP
jgi:hypothetical protein